MEGRGSYHIYRDYHTRSHPSRYEGGLEGEGGLAQRERKTLCAVEAAHHGLVQGLRVHEDAVAYARPHQSKV